MNLPTHYLITPACEDEAQFLPALERSLEAGTRLMLLKGKGLELSAYAALARRVIPLADRYGCKVLLTGDPGLVVATGAHGLHLDSEALSRATARPLAGDYLLAVSGHSAEALHRGVALGANFGVLSPVKYTKTHPDLEPLGWEGLAAVAATLGLPIYALGGVGRNDEDDARAAGAQGIAGHRGYWGE